MMYEQRQSASGASNLQFERSMAGCIGSARNPSIRNALIAALLTILASPALAGDAAQGKALLERRESANCVLCHAIPGVRGDFGNIGPSLAGVGGRLSREAMRRRIADPARLKAGAVMPAYFRTNGLVQVAPEFRGKTILSRDELDDVVEYLLTLK